MTEPVPTPQPDAPINTVPDLPPDSDGEVVLSRVTTYQDAVKEAIRSQSVSTASMLMAEERRRDVAQHEEAQTSLKTPKNKFLLAGAGVLLTLGLLTLGFAFLSRDDGNTPPPKSQAAERFFPADGVIDVAAAQLSQNTLIKLDQVLKSPMPRGSIQQISIIREEVGSAGGNVQTIVGVPYTSEALLALVRARIDSSFGRAIDDIFFLGVHATAANETFLMFKINTFDTVFATLFNWEANMAKDLEPLFPVLKPINQPQPTVINTQETSSTSSTEATPTLPQRTTAGLFSDQVIANSDARVIKDSTGNVIFFYTFIDEEYVYFGTKPQTLQEVKKRLRSAKLVL
ncbi:MAG: hypothetical protein RL150_607 [Candidatus Parcubacteria bacterium]|jgi:hypothetical protein